MQFGVFSVSDITPDPTTGRTGTEAERIRGVVAIATMLVGGPVYT